MENERQYNTALPDGYKIPLNITIGVPDTIGDDSGKFEQIQVVDVEVTFEQYIHFDEPVIQSQILAMANVAYGRILGFHISQAEFKTVAEYLMSISPKYCN